MLGAVVRPMAQVPPVPEIGWRCMVIFSMEGWQMQQGQNAEVLLDGSAKEQHSPCPKRASDVLQTFCQEQLICHLKSGIKMGQRCKMSED